MRNLITRTDTTKATRAPTARVISSAVVKAKPNFTSFSRLRPNITGTARKKVNSAAATRDTPMSRAPMMVEPDREVPGMMESTWNRPMRKAVQ